MGAIQEVGARPSRDKLRVLDIRGIQESDQLICKLVHSADILLPRLLLQLLPDLADLRQSDHIAGPAHVVTEEDDRIEVSSGERSCDQRGLSAHVVQVSRDDGA